MRHETFKAMGFTFQMRWTHPSGAMGTRYVLQPDACGWVEVFHSHDGDWIIRQLTQNLTEVWHADLTSGTPGPVARALVFAAIEGAVNWQPPQTEGLDR
jgi:hypothetical protein